MRRKARARRARTSPAVADVWACDGWKISVSRADRTVRFATTDYHAGPLTLTKRELHDLAKLVVGRTWALPRARSFGR